MNCNCSKSYAMPMCIETLQIGVVDPGLTDLIVQFKCLITSRIIRIEGVDPDDGGLLQVDVSTLTNFFSPNLEIEMTVLSSLENEGDLIPVKVGGTSFECVLLDFEVGETDFASIAIIDHPVSHLKFTSNPTVFRATGIAIQTTFEGVLIADFGDNSTSLIYSGAMNSHAYADVGTYHGDVKGIFESMTAMNMSSCNLIDFVLPPINGITSLLLNINKLPVSVVNHILQNLDANGNTGGTVNLGSQTPAATPTGPGLTAKNSLISNGWTVTTD